jgi:hypothetical protein
LVSFSFRLNKVQRTVTVTRIGDSVIGNLLQQVANVGGLQNSLSGSIAAVVAFLVHPCFLAHINRKTFLVRKTNKRIRKDAKKLNIEQLEGGAFDTSRVHNYDENTQIAPKVKSDLESLCREESSSSEDEKVKQNIVEKRSSSCCQSI